MTDRKKLIDDAEDILGISICDSYGGRLAYHAEETRQWYWITLSDLRCARDFARDDAEADEEPYSSPYSLWCAATSVKEVQSCETKLGLSLSCKCNVLNSGRSLGRCANR